MSNADLWLRQLAARQEQDARALASSHTNTTKAVQELWEELQRCAAIFNFHSPHSSHIKVFLRATDAADVVFSSATTRLVYRHGKLRLSLITITAFVEQEREKVKFKPQFSKMGILYWENVAGQQFSNDMVVRYVFERLLEHTS